MQATRTTRRKPARRDVTDYHDWALGHSERNIPSLMCTACGKHLGTRTGAAEWKAKFYSLCPGFERR